LQEFVNRLMGVGAMKPFKAMLLSFALAGASLSAAAPALADTTTVDPTQVSTLVSDIEAAINALPAGSSVTAIETAINGAIAKDGFSGAVAASALQVVQTSEASGSNASVAVASLETSIGNGTGAPQAGGQGGGSPIGGPASGSSSGSGYTGK
jgi:hypothetical protein